MRALTSNLGFLWRAVRQRGRERATRNHRGVEFRNIEEKEREEQGEGTGKGWGRGWGGGGIGKGEGIDNGEPGVTAILYLARHDRVNELRLRGGPIMGLFLSSGPPSLRELQSDLTKWLHFGYHCAAILRRLSNFLNSCAIFAIAVVNFEMFRQRSWKIYKCKNILSNNG